MYRQALGRTEKIATLSERIVPLEILHHIVSETDDFETLRSLCFSTKSASAAATKRMLKLAIAQDRNRIRDPGFLVYGNCGLGLTSHHNDFEYDDEFDADGNANSDGDENLTHRDIANHNCQQSTGYDADPVVLWAAAQPLGLAIGILREVEQIAPDQLWSLFLVPARSCRGHWKLPRDLPTRHALNAAIHVAAQHGNTEIVRWLLDHQSLAALAPPSVLWPHLGDTAMTSEIRPIDVPAIQPCVCPSHHFAVYAKAKRIVHSKDLPWASALHIALSHSHIETSKLLVDRGANWAAPNIGSQGVTGLNIACANGLVLFLDHLLISDWSQGRKFQFTSVNSPREDDSDVPKYQYLSAVGSVAHRRMILRRLRALEDRVHVFLDTV